MLVRFIKLDVLPVLVIVVLCWQAGPLPLGTDLLPQKLAVIWATDNDLSVTRVWVELFGLVGCTGVCVSLSVCQCVTVHQAILQGRLGLDERMTQFANGAGNFLSSIIVKHAHTLRECVDRYSRESSLFKHLLQVSSPTPILPTLM